MSSNPWDSPWDDPRAEDPRTSDKRRRGSRHGRGGWAGGGGSWTGGPPPWVQSLMDLAQSGGAGPFSGPLTGRGGPKVRRGDVRSAILDVLSVEPANGYQVIQQIADRTGGAWKPSPGSVYPTVQQLEDEGLIEGVENNGRRLLTLTEEGQRYVVEHADELARTWRPFDEAEGEQDQSRTDLKPMIGQVMGAVWNVVMSGTRQQQAEAAEILADTRRRLYGLLAEGDEGESA